MERKIDKTKTLLKKLSFTVFVAVLICGGFFWGIRVILQINATYDAAIATTRDIGIYAQRIASYSNRLLNSQNPTVYRANQEMIKNLVRKLEVKHLNMTQGAPMLVRNRSYSSEIKAVYFGMPTNLVNQVRDFIAHSKQLYETPFEKIHPEDPHAAHIRIAVQGNLIQSISHIIQEFIRESDTRITQSILMLAALMLVMSILAVAGYFFLIDERLGLPPQQGRPAPADSVSTVLGGLSVYPGKRENGMEYSPEDDFSTENLVGN